MQDFRLISFSAYPTDQPTVNFRTFSRHRPLTVYNLAFVKDLLPTTHISDRGFHAVEATCFGSGPTEII